MIGKLVGHYRILEQIGAGGMGEIFRARDERLGRDVALKLIRPASSDNPDHLRRFEQEARAAAALNHPNIVAIYDIGLEGTTPYIVSELLVGQDLRCRLLEGPIPPREAANYSLQIVQGLIAAHERHIVHRDLKPENLFLTTEGRIKILDFGVAKLQSPIAGERSIEKLTTVTKSGTVIGTVAYMSPEQLRAKAVDHRSDLFSLGAILYEMLAGHRAFRGETEVDTMSAVLREEPPEASLEQAAIPSGYREVIKHCLEKDPDNRFQSAKDLAFALQTLAGSPTGTALIPGLRWKKNRVVLFAACAVLAVATLAVAILQFPPPASPPTYARVTFELGTIYSARFASEGHTIVYGAAWNGHPIQLFTTVGDSFQIQPLLNRQEANLLAISGKNNLALVLHGTRTGQLEIDGGMLAVAPLAEGSPHERMADVRWADWDLAGKNLAVVHYLNGHTQLEYPEGKALYQTEGWISHIRFSPQGDKIAFMNHPVLWDNKGAVCVTDLSGHVQNLTGVWESEQGLAWRPDGKEIWFSAADKGNNLNLIAVDLSGKTRTLLTSPIGLALQDIAADGRVLVAAQSKRLEMALSVRGTKEDTILSWHDWNVVKDISRDGQFVLFEDASEVAGARYAVALRKLDGSLPTELGEGNAGGLSPDGKWAIAISSGKPQQLTLLPTGPGQARPIDLGGLDHVETGWSSFLDDDHILVNGDESDQGDRCYILNSNGGKAKAVTPVGTPCGPPSSDGRLIATAASNSLTIYPVGGGMPRSIPGQIAGATVAFRPVQWSNDNSALYGYHRGELPSKTYKLEIATGKETVLQELQPTTPAGVVLVSPIVISRDGSRAAYSYSQILSTLYIISGLRE